MARRGGDTLAFAKRKDHSEAKEPAEGVSASLDHTDGLEARVTGRRLSGRSPVPGEGAEMGPQPQEALGSRKRVGGLSKSDHPQAGVRSPSVGSAPPRKSPVLVPKTKQEEKDSSVP